MSVRAFVDEHFQHFNAGALRDTARSLTTFVEQGGVLVLTLAGAMSTAGLGRSIAPLIRAGHVGAISCTGANLEEDLFRLVALNHYEAIPDWRGLSAQDEGCRLRRRERGGGVGRRGGVRGGRHPFHCHPRCRAGTRAGGT